MKQNKEEPLPPGFQERRAVKRKFDSNVGNLFKFTYSTGDKTTISSTPFILNLRRNNQKSFKARNGNTYIAGIKLNAVSDTILRLLIKKFYDKGIVTWRDVSAANKFGRLPYRIYNVKKVKNLKRVDASIYLEEEGEFPTT